MANKLNGAGPATPSKKGRVPNESKIISDIHKLFDRYGPLFVDLAVGRRSDMDALLEIYSAPLRFIGSDFHMIMADKAAIIGKEGIGGYIYGLQNDNFGGSTLDKCDITVLNARAALVDAIWLRHDVAGDLLERFGATYLVALTSEGWRITSAVDKSV